MYVTTLPDYRVTFKEHGLPIGTGWNVTIGSNSYSTNGTIFSVSLPNGTYPFTVASAGYNETSGPPSPLAVNGAAVKVAVAFT